MIPAG